MVLVFDFVSFIITMSCWYPKQVKIHLFIIKCTLEGFSSRKCLFCSTSSLEIYINFQSLALCLNIKGNRISICLVWSLRKIIATNHPLPTLSKSGAATNIVIHVSQRKFVSIQGDWLPTHNFRVGVILKPSF